MMIGIDWDLYWRMASEKIIDYAYGGKLVNLMELMKLGSLRLLEYNFNLNHGLFLIVAVVLWNWT